MKRPRAAPRLPWLAPLLLTLAFAGLVGAAVADRNDWSPPAWTMGLAAVALGGLHFLLPRGLQFAIGTTAGLAMYMALFVVIGRAAFPRAGEAARGLGFLLPVATFLTAVVLRRRPLRAMAERGGPVDIRHLRRMARWMVPAFAVGALCMAFPVNRLPAEAQGLALLAAMGAIAIIVAASVHGVVLLLVDTALIMEELGGRIAVVALRMVAFTMVYVVLVVAFAALYRIADGLSHEPLFHTPVGAHWLAFPDALYFSLVSQATVGYGDLVPRDDGVRLLAAVQVVLGQLLLLFGFAELMRGRGEDAAPRPEAADPPAISRRNRAPE